jgi:hypothetical protein
MASENPAGDSSVRDEIVRLEREVKRLSKAFENCQKVIFISRTAFVLGILWLLALSVGALSFSPLSLICAISVVILSVVSFGSNVGTLRQLIDAIAEAEARRTELIGAIELKPVQNRRTYH